LVAEAHLRADTGPVFGPLSLYKPAVWIGVVDFDLDEAACP